MERVNGKDAKAKALEDLLEETKKSSSFYQRYKSYVIGGFIGAIISILIGILIPVF